MQDNYSEKKDIFDLKIRKLINLLKESNKTVVLTGAGISTLSGIPDFRGEHGIYSKKWTGLNVEDIISLTFFRRNPDIFYKWAKDVWFNLENYEPNIVHIVLHKLEKLGLIHEIYTQNIDLLHQKAGSISVKEIHGSPYNNHCTSCNKNFSYEYVSKIVKEGKVPHCPDCNGIIKPDIVFYEESLNVKLLEKAFSDFSNCDLCLVLGSSLTVQPASSLPLLSVNNLSKLVIVNASTTPLDKNATLCFKDLNQVFTEINKIIDSKSLV